MEALRYTKEILKKNSLRIALGVSLAANGATVFDANVNNGAAIKATLHGVEEAGKKLAPCDYDPEYYQKNQKYCDDPYKADPMHW